MSARRALVVFLFAAGCFGLGLAAARLGGSGPPPPAPSLPAEAASGPQIHIDAGSIVLHDGSLHIDLPPPPDVGAP